MTTATNKIREATKIVTAHRQAEGAGFIVRRPFPSATLTQVDPFLMIDEMGPAEYGPGEALGAPDHPHRGFETVSYMLDGEFEHEERYQEVPSAKIPEGRSDDGRAKVRVVAGEALGVRAVIETNTPIVFQDWTLEGGADVTTTIAEDHNALVYVFGGAVLVGDDAKEVKDGQLAVLGAGDAVRLRVADGAAAPARLLLLAGVPIAETVVQYGPFVMNTKDEIRQAIVDFQTGRMGEITRTAEVSHGSSAE